MWALPFRLFKRSALVLGHRRRLRAEREPRLAGLLPTTRRKPRKSSIQLTINSIPHKCKVMSITFIVGAAQIAQQLDLPDDVVHAFGPETDEAVVLGLVSRDGLAAKPGLLHAAARAGRRRCRVAFALCLCPGELLLLFGVDETLTR